MKTSPAAAAAFTEERHIHDWLTWMLLPPLLMTLAGIGHGLYSYALLTGLLPELPLVHLSHGLRQVVQRDGLLQLAQLLLVLLFVLFVCSCWLFLVLRNQAVLREAGATRPLLRLARWLAPLPRFDAGLLPGAAGDRWLAPLWWLLLLGAAACTAMGGLQLRALETVGDWRLGYYWVVMAYALYLAFFVLSRRLVRHLEALQRIYWQHRDATESAAAHAVLSGDTV